MNMKYVKTLSQKIEDLNSLIVEYKRLNLDENILKELNNFSLSIIRSCNNLMSLDKPNWNKFNRIINKIDKFCCKIRNEISCYYCEVLLAILGRYSFDVVIKVIPNYYCEVKPILEETLNKRNHYNSLDRFRYLKNIYDDIERKISSLDELQEEENERIKKEKRKTFWLQFFLPITAIVISLSGVVASILIAIFK